VAFSDAPPARAEQPSTLGVCEPGRGFVPRRSSSSSSLRLYFFRLPEISAAGTLVLGGETAVSGGECAPADSSGFATAGVAVDT
jgi:hypothetical protein